jgi:hypothetical protein
MVWSIGQRAVCLVLVAMGVACGSIEPVGGTASDGSGQGAADVASPGADAVDTALDAVGALDALDGGALSEDAAADVGGGAPDVGPGGGELPDAGGPDAHAAFDGGAADAPDAAEPLPVDLSIAGFEAIVGEADATALDAFVAAYDMPICEAGACLFVTVQSGAGDVVLAGDFTGWEPGPALERFDPGSDVFWGVAPLVVDDVVAYKLLVDGAWTYDGSNLYFRWGGFGPDSAIYAPGRSRLARLRDVHSPELDNVRDLYVYLPAPYFEDAAAHFPVLYMADGFNVFANPQAPFGHWDLDATLDALIGAGAVAPLLVVGVDTSNRIEEYAYAPLTLDGGPPGEALLPQYAEFVVDTLIPRVGDTFRVAAGPENTGIGGSSLGGISALWIAWFHPDVFGRVASLSGSYWIGEAEPAADATPMRELIAAGGGGATPETLRIYLDSGDTPFAGAPSYLGDAWVYSDWTRNALIARGWPNRPEWDTDGDLGSPPDDLAASTPVGQVPALAWSPQPPEGAAAWDAYLGAGTALLSLVGHGHKHQEAAWSVRAEAALRFLFPPAP